MSVEKRMPGGIPYIIGNETAERFNFYGMRAILVIYMTKYLLDNTGALNVMTEDEAKTIFHLSNSAIYFFPILGAFLADVLIGKYWTIFSVSLIYCLGSIVLAYDQTRFGLYVGLTLIAIGSGGIKPCVSAVVGDQFTDANKGLMEKAYNYFYAGINAGALVSMFLTPILLEHYGPRIAFGVPAVMMFAATIVFWAGRNKYKRLPANSKRFYTSLFSEEGITAVVKSSIIFAFIAMFWSLYDQSGSAWVLQAEKMDREFLGIEWLSSQIQIVNPLLILILAPFFAKYGYDWINKVFPLTPLRKIGIGFFVTIPSFLIPAFIEVMIQNGEVPNIVWQLLAYFWITVAEVFVSITGLEFAYKQAPPAMKSAILALFLLSVSLGNAFTSGVNWFIQKPGASFTPDVPGIYMLELHATDGKETVKDVVTIEVTSPQPEREETAEEREVKTKQREKEIEEQLKHHPLVASAGSMRAVVPGTQVNLYGTVDMKDSKGGLEYDWHVVQSPATTGKPSDHHGRIYRFTPDVEGEYKFQFTATAGGDSSTSTATIVTTTSNVAPIVEAGEKQTVEIGTSVALDGSASFDPNGDRLKYEWYLVTQPFGSASVLENPTQPSVTSKLSGPWYYIFFAMMLLVTSLIYIPVALRYKPQEYIQPT